MCMQVLLRIESLRRGWETFVDPKQAHPPICKDWICVNFVLLQFRPMQVSYQYNDVKIYSFTVRLSSSVRVSSLCITSPDLVLHGRAHASSVDWLSSNRFIHGLTGVLLYCRPFYLEDFSHQLSHKMFISKTKCCSKWENSYKQEDRLRNK